jgi:hypothetical protein
VGGPGHHIHQTSKIRYSSNSHSVQELQTEIEAAAKEIIGDNYVVHLQRVYEVKGSHIEHEEHINTKYPHK